VKVLDGNGDPVQAQLGLRELDEAGAASETERTMHTIGRDGTAWFRGLGRKRYVLSSEGHDVERDFFGGTRPWVSGAVLADLRSGVDMDLEIRLREGTLVGLRVQGEDPTGWPFDVVDHRGWPVVSGRLQSSKPRALRLPPGSYGVSVRDPAGTFEALRNLVVGTEPVEVAIGR
jgi:hypothetical protein